ncbi:diphosphate--fructose-6-phosphate 1-phosphotransferase [Trifolium repens]|nr:diphosphate--fructose-6-phosphate 1-phosphotransferase [Trifolium repens]
MGFDKVLIFVLFLMVQLLRVEFGDSTTTANPFYKVPDAYGHPLALRATAKVPDAQIITEHPPIRVGIVFCGRQSPGGHNVIWGLHSALKIHNPNSVLLGLLVYMCQFYFQHISSCCIACKS